MRKKWFVLLPVAIAAALTVPACHSGTNPAESSRISESRTAGTDSDSFESQPEEAASSESGGAESGGSSSETILKPGSSRASGGVSSGSSSVSAGGTYLMPSSQIKTPQEKKLYEKIKGTTIRVVMGEEESKILPHKRAKHEYMEKKYGVKLKIETMSGGEQHSKIAPMVAAGNPPDVTPVSQEIFLRYVYSNTIQALDPYVVDDPGWTRYSLQYYRTNGKVYAVAWNEQEIPVSMVYFNKTLFEEQKVKTPYEHYKSGTWTWETLVETAKKMTLYREDGKTVKTYGIGTWNYPVFMLANGGTGIAETAPGKFQVTLDRPAEMKGLQVLHELSKAGAYSMIDNYVGFSQRLVAMHIERPQSAIGGLDYYNRMEDEVGMAPLPKAADGKFYAPMNAHGFAVPRNAKNPYGGLMYAYERWKIEEVHLTVTTGPEAEERRNMISDEHLKIYKDYIAKATPIHTFMEGLSGWWDGPRGQFWDEMLKGEKEPAVAVDSMKKVLSESLKRTVG